MTGPIDPCTLYALLVTSGAELAGPHVRAACRRHLADLEASKDPERGIWFDPDEAARAYAFFENRLKLAEGQFEGLPFKLHMSQSFILGSLIGWKRKNDEGLEVRRFRRAYIEQAKGNGKSLCIRTYIPTPSGGRTMGDLLPGDTVLDELGRPCRVTAVSGHMYNRPCRRLSFSDGTVIITDIDHLWKTNGIVRTTGDIEATIHERHMVDHRMIVACEPVWSVPTQCISVDSPSRMFLAGRTMIPTHNSPLVGGLGLFGMLIDREPGAQIYSAGATYDQASILFNDAVKMARAQPDWNDDADRMIHYYGNAKVYNMCVLNYPQNGSFFRPISREKARSGSGPRPHMALCDELHEHPDGGVLEMLERGFKFRRQPLMIMITNSGSDRKSVCWAEHEHAVKVAHCDIQDDATFSYVCALDEADRPLDDPACWKKANPLLGVTITEEYLRGVVKQAKDIAGKQNNILRLHFCLWTDAQTAWISRKTWEACEDKTLKIEDMYGRKAWGGLDLSQTKDLTASAWVFEDGWADVEDVNCPGSYKRKPRYVLWIRAYTPKDTLYERVKADRAPYDVWARDGHLTATPGPVIRLDIVASDMVADYRRFSTQGVAYDQYLIRDFKHELDELGSGDLLMYDHPQGTSYRRDSDLFMPGSVDKFETLILERRIRIFVNPVLRSAVAGATFWTSPAGLKRFEKAKATSRIDAAVAAAMAVGLATLNEPDDESVWDKRARTAKVADAVIAPLPAGDEIDYVALNDPDHPHHRVMVRRFHEQQDADEDEYA